MPAGSATIRYEFVYDGVGAGKGGTGTIFVNGQKVATARIDQTQGYLFSADEGADVGLDDGTAVTSAYAIPFKFNGKIKKVTIDLKETSPSEAINADKARREAAIKSALSH